MLDEGSGGRTSIEMHEALAAIGAHLESDIGSDASLLGTSVLSRFAGDALSLLGDFAVRPSLTEADFTRVRQLRLNRLRQLRDMPGAVADRAFTRLLYGSHPYGHTPLGTEQSLTSLSVDDVRRFHAGALRPSEATLVAVGDCDHADDRAARSRRVRRLERHGKPAAARPDRDAGVVAPCGGSPRQGAAVRACASDTWRSTRSNPDFHALVAANMVLGGQFVSRDQSQPARGQGHYLRRAHGIRLPPPPGPVRVECQRADGSDRDSRLPNRSGRSRRFADPRRSRTKSSRSVWLR